MYLLYNLIALAVIVMYLPAYLARRKFHRGFLRRLGVLPQGLMMKRPVWVHAVSLGEARSVRALVEMLRSAYPQKQFVLSTVTATGNKVARQMAREVDLVTYLPLDFSFIVRNTIARTNPCIFIIAETEIWPNLISCLFKRNIPIVIVNGRISDRSLRGYRLIRFLIEPILRKVSLFCVQSDSDAARFASLGVKPQNIRVSGNIKFDIEDNPRPKEEAAGYRRKLGLGEGDRLLVCGSTHPGEEENLLNIYRQLSRDYRGLRLLIAPRHPERAMQIEGLVRKAGFEAFATGRLAEGGTKDGKVFVVDSIGELMGYYAAADLVFVGGSLVKKGGHNILEPAVLAKPVIFGPYMFNFRDIVRMFLDNQAALSVRDSAELELGLRGLLDNPAKALDLGSRGRQLILANRGATGRVLKEIKPFFSSPDHPFI
ncbi:MAG: 3-deoxy-D-manno-octulosonic acid transferase [Candidatus Omnitrophota bacterium]